MNTLENSSSDIFNVVNSGNNTIVFLMNGSEIDILYSFDLIIQRFMEIEVLTNQRITPEVKEWLTHNFVSWLRKGVPGIEEIADEKTDEIKRQLLYPTNDSIRDIIEQYPNVTRQDIIDQLPDYINKDADGSIVFCGGRLFRIGQLFNGRFSNKIHLDNLIDYLLTSQQVAVAPNDHLMPPQLVTKKMYNLTPVEAFQKSYDWHVWVEKNKDRITKEQMKASLQSLRRNIDFDDDIEFIDGGFAIRLKSRLAAEVEGKAMKHCVGGYGKDIESGRTHISSIRDSDGYPQVTIEWDPEQRYVKQMKGHANGKVKEHVIKNAQEWLKHHNIQRANDLQNVGLASLSQLYEEKKEKKETGETKKEVEKNSSLIRKLFT